MGTPTDPAALEQDAAWSRGIFAMLADGGTWGVPRSGLIFKRVGAELVLTDRMPWTAEIADAAEQGADVPLSAAELAWYQDTDYETIRDRFGRAGITVRKGETDAERHTQG